MCAFVTFNKKLLTYLLTYLLTKARYSLPYNDAITFILQKLLNAFQLNFAGR